MEQVTTLRGKYVQIKEQHKEWFDKFVLDPDDAYKVVVDFYGVDLSGTFGDATRHYVLIELYYNEILEQPIPAEYFDVVKDDDDFLFDTSLGE
jgi:hypothetical protein